MGRPLQGGPSFRELEEFKGEEMRIQAAVVKEQRVTFAIVVVKRHVIQRNGVKSMFREMGSSLCLTLDGNGVKSMFDP